MVRQRTPEAPTARRLSGSFTARSLTEDQAPAPSAAATVTEPAPRPVRAPVQPAVRPRPARNAYPRDVVSASAKVTAVPPARIAAPRTTSPRPEPALPPAVPTREPVARPASAPPSAPPSAPAGELLAPSRRVSTPTTRRRRVVLIGLVLPVLATPIVVSNDAVGGVGPRPAADALAPGEALAIVAPPARAERAPAEPVAFAAFEDVTLSLPARRVRLVGFHEASYDNALEMSPLGRLSENHNTTKFSPPDELDAGPRYVVLSSRGRGNPATSAVDVALEPDTAVRSVATGEIVLVKSYMLYGRYPDTRIEIAPAARPDLRIVIIHAADPKVREGDRVEAGRTVIAGRANHFPFTSHVDRYVRGDAGPHIHIEIKYPAPPGASPSG